MSGLLIPEIHSLPLFPIRFSSLSQELQVEKKRADAEDRKDEINWDADETQDDDEEAHEISSRIWRGALSKTTSLCSNAQALPSTAAIISALIEEGDLKTGYGTLKGWTRKKITLIRPASVVHTNSNPPSPLHDSTAKGNSMPESGLDAYYWHNNSEDSAINDNWHHNIRATRLAMACGLFHVRFHGPVLLVRPKTLKNEIPVTDQYNNNTHDTGFLSFISEIEEACSVSPDLRRSTLSVLRLAKLGTEVDDTNDNKWGSPWLLGLTDAAQNHYRHAAACAQFLSRVLMSERSSLLPSVGRPADFDKEDDDEGEDLTSSRSASAIVLLHSDVSSSRGDGEFVATSPLCWYCRRPATQLCSICQGVYFCDPPSPCRTLGWSHECNCSTWKLYVDRRGELSTIDGLGDWHHHCTSRPFQLSSDPYQQFLAQQVGVGLGHFDSSNTKGQESNAELDVGLSLADSSCSPWWVAELDGWCGGQSPSARLVDASLRPTFAEGFFPQVDIPREEPVLWLDMIESGLPLESNELGFVCVSSWSDYYRIRKLPPSSLVALLLTYPLTLHYAIVRYGQVPCTVAQMLERPLRIHVVGAEKELCFLDLFKEVSFLLPPDMAAELVFVVRPDMLPPLCREQGSFRVRLMDQLSVYVVAGTYADSLDPNFDCGSGPPDMVMAFNAGLYAYESWRSVVTFLDQARGVVGVFTDYNEYSAVCSASLGGAACRESVTINPFRQPRAMPVYSMNLPQFCNGFMYVMNEQSL